MKIASQSITNVLSTNKKKPNSSTKNCRNSSLNSNESIQNSNNLSEILPTSEENQFQNFSESDILNEVAFTTNNIDTGKPADGKILLPKGFEKGVLDFYFFTFCDSIFYNFLLVFIFICF